MQDFGKLDFSVSFNPTSGFPLDARCEFDSYDAALAAAQEAGEVGNKTSKYHYGMILTVHGDVVQKYVIQTDGTLELLGTGAGSGSIPVFDLTALGLPTVTIDGDTVSVTTDTTEIVAAMDAGAIKVTANYEYRGVVVSGLQTVIQGMGGVGAGVQNVLINPIAVSLWVYNGSILVRAVLVNGDSATEEDVTTEAELMPSTELAFTDSGEGLYMLSVSPAPFALTEGETYYVDWDGTVYECVATVVSGMPTIGNLSIEDSSATDSGEPFLYVYGADGGDETSVGVVATLDTSATHTVRVYQIVQAATLPAPTAGDNGAFLRVVDGAPAWESPATAVDLSAYESSGKIVETFADGTTKTTTVEFDSDGNPVKITDGYGNVTTLTW